MPLKLFYIYYYLLLVLNVYCETTTESTEKLLDSYRKYINASHDLDRSDKTLIKVWTTDFLIQIVNITSCYRLDVARHREHNFMDITGNLKWKDCLDLHQNEVTKAKKYYYDEERKCVESANEECDEKKHDVWQMEREIRKWRKSYRYLSNQCNVNNPGEDVAAGECLVEYMQKDDYNVTFQRLILLKLESMSQLYNQILSSLRTLDVCLKTTFSRYLSDVRLIMKNLNHCYKTQ